MGDHGVFLLLLLLLLHNCNLEELSFCRSHSFFFCVLCFVLHARACLTLELPRSLAVCYLMLSSGPELVLSVYKNVYKPTHFPRNSMDSISNIRTGSEAHTMCTRVSRGNGKKKRNSIMFVHGLHTYCIAGHVEKGKMKRWAKREERKKKK